MGENSAEGSRGEVNDDFPGRIPGRKLPAYQGEEFSGGFDAKPYR